MVDFVKGRVMRRLVRVAGVFLGIVLIAGMSHFVWFGGIDLLPDSWMGEVQETAVPASVLSELEVCGHSQAVHDIKEKLLATASPLRKEASFRSYRVSGEFLGLKVREMEIGVCDSTGSRECGWGNYVGLIVELPLPKVRQILQTRFGIDFTQELRDNDVLMTDRPVLSEDKPGRSRLHYDPGTL